MLRNLIVSSLFLFIGAVQVLSAQVVSNHKVISYSPKEYAAHNQTWQAVQDDNGVMYFANGDGLLQFDGVEWKLNLSAKETNVLSIGLHQDGRIYYGGAGEIGYYERNDQGGLVPTQIHVPGYKEDLESEFFWSTHISGDRVVFRSENFWVVYEGGVSTAYGLDDMVVKSSFLIDDYIWYQELYNGLYKVHVDSAGKMMGQKVLRSEELPKVSIQGIVKWSTDKYLITGSAIALELFDPVHHTFDHFDSDLDAYTDLNIAGLVALPNNKIAVSTNNYGVFILNKYGSIVSHYKQSNGLLSDFMREMFVDREGVLWLTSDVGVHKILCNKNYTLLTEAFQEVTGVPNSILEDDGQLIIATNEGVFYIGTQSGVMKTKRLEGFNEQVFDLIKFKNQVLCATTSGVYSLEPNDFQLVYPSYSRALMPVEDDYLLIGGRKTITLLKEAPGKWQQRNKLDFSDEFLHLERDPEHTDMYWGGLYSSGAVRIKVDTETDIITYKHYDPSIIGFDGYILPFSVRDRMIFAPKLEDVFAYDAEVDAFVSDSLTAALFDEPFSSWIIKEDVFGNLYYEASGPIYFCRKTAANQYEVDQSSLANLNVGYVNDIFCSATGDVWLVAEEDIIRFNPEMMTQTTVENNVIIKKVTMNADSILFSGFLDPSEHYAVNDLTLDYRNNNITFDFVSTYFSDEAPLQYSYFLEGNDQHFSAWSEDRKAVYTNLAEGTYTFMVKSRNADGVESEAYVFSFTVLPPWYRTWYAYLSFIALGGLIVFGIVKLNSLRLKIANEALKAVVAEKTKAISANLEEISYQKDQLQERNNDIIDSINYAQRLQNAILPAMRDIDRRFASNFVLYKPKDIVAGDFYWLNAKDEQTMIAVADCTGHGVPGALVSVVCNNALNRATKEFKLNEPNEILSKVNELVHETFSSSNESEDLKVRDGMDIALCSIDTTKMEVSFAGANNSLWVVTKQDYSNQTKLLHQEGELNVFEVKADRQSVGSGGQIKPFTLSKLKLNAGDQLYMFSDGFVDQFGGEKFGKIKKFKRKNLIQLFVTSYTMEMSAQRSRLDEVFEQWRGEEEQIDDVTVIGIRV